MKSIKLTEQDKVNVIKLLSYGYSAKAIANIIPCQLSAIKNFIRENKEGLDDESKES